MSFLANYVVILCISTVFGVELMEYETKTTTPTHVYTRLEVNKSNFGNQKNNTSFNSQPSNEIVSQKSVETFTDMKSVNEHYQDLENRPLNIDRTEHLSEINRNLRTNTIIPNEDHKNAEKLDLKVNESKLFTQKSREGFENVVSMLIKGLEKEAELKSTGKYYKNQDLVNNILKDETYKIRRGTRSTKDVTILSQHNNLLSLLIDVVNRIRSSQTGMSEQNRDMISKLVESMLSVLFGPSTHILWPAFARVVVVLLKAIT